MRIRSVGYGLALATVAVAMGVFGGTSEVLSGNVGEWEIIVQPNDVVAGKDFHVFARYTDDGGQGSLSLFVETEEGEEAIVALESPQKYTYDSGFIQLANSWTLEALEPGTQQLRVYVYYENFLLCDEFMAEPTCEYFTSFVSDEHTFTVEIEPAPKATPTDPERLVGDVNGDGQVDSVDAALILQYAAGLLPNLGGG